MRLTNIPEQVTDWTQLALAPAKSFGILHMNSANVTAQLESIAAAGDDFEWQSHQLTEGWKNEPENPDIVESILRFMEGHPEIEYGTPGPLVHFVEAFPNYEEKLLESIERQPTPHTVGMLNRVINGKRDPQERQAILLVMARVLENAAADAMTRNRASGYLEFQGRRDLAGRSIH